MKAAYKHKLPSGALQFTLFIAVIIAILLGAAVLLVYSHRFFTEQSKIITKTIRLADTGIAALQRWEQTENDTVLLAIPNAGEHQQVQMHLSHWGLFEKAWVRSSNRNKAFTKCALLGSGAGSMDRPSIYLADTYKPLAVVGTTTITGNALLPQQGVKTGSIAGHSYYGGTNLINGNISNSKLELPSLNYDYRKLLTYYLDTYEPENDSYISVTRGGKTINSFEQPVKGYYSRTDIVLENISIRGNIIIRSDTKITVRQSADLKDIILAAPVIVIEDGFTGSLQAVADTAITIGESCTLTYPSALVLIEKQKYPGVEELEKNDNSILVGEKSVVKGVLCFLKERGESQENYNTNIYTAETAIVYGEIYCEGNSELRGTLSGTVYTRHFLTRERGTNYINHLYNVTIDNKLPEAYGGIIFEDKPKNVVKWLY